MNIKYEFNSIDWQSIQEAHDNGLRWKNIKNHFNISFHALEKGVKLGLLTKNSFTRSHSDETKKKLSLLRKEFLAQNPDKHPWKNNRLISEPCEYLKKIFKIIFLKTSSSYTFIFTSFTSFKRKPRSTPINI